MEILEDGMQAMNERMKAVNEYLNQLTNMMQTMVANFVIENSEWFKKGKAKKLEGVFSLGNSLILRVIT